MFEPVVTADLPSLFAVPVARCDAAGVIAAWNPEFEAWASPVAGDRVSIHGARGLLLSQGANARPLVMVALADGGWLAMGSVGENHGAVAAVAAVVAQRLERVESSLVSNAQIGLMDGPSEPVAGCLRETLATADEVRLLRRQVAALGAHATTERVPACLRALVRESAAALRPLRIVLDAVDGDYTVELDRARFFPILVELLGDLSLTPCPDAPLHVALRGGDFVRLHATGPAVPFVESAGIAAMRRFLAAAGGRALFIPGESVTLEVPSFALGLGAGGGYGTVLVVDDDESTLAMMAAVLRRAGFQVRSASDGVAASSLLRQHPGEFVAIVADAVLPGRSGVELAAEARRSSPDVPVLLVSGHSSDLLGVHDVEGLTILTKPFGARALADRVRALIHAAQPHG